jgi:hypothetical protein
MEKRFILRMTGVTPGVFASFLDKNRLDFGLKILVVQRRFFRGGFFRGSLLLARHSGRLGRRANGSHAKRGCNYQHFQMAQCHRMSSLAPAESRRSKLTLKE